jgi:hypothetical protein
MKKIIYKTNNYPIIYLRYFENNLIYIGESFSLFCGRHAREDIQSGNYDKIIIIKACKNEKRRRYWEAYLICKLKPTFQSEMKKYKTLLNNEKNVKKIKTKQIKFDLNKTKKQQILYTAYDHLNKFNRCMKLYKGN